MRCVSRWTTKSFGTSPSRSGSRVWSRGGHPNPVLSHLVLRSTKDPVALTYHTQYTSAAQMSMADDAPPAMPRSEPFGMMHEHEPDPTYAASNHDARLYASAASAQHG